MDKQLFYLEITSFLLFITLWLLTMDLFLQTNSSVINLTLVATSLILILMLYRLRFREVKKSKRAKRRKK